MIRRATVIDITALIKLGRKHYETSQHSYGFDESMFALNLVELITNNEYITLVAEVDNKVVGYFSGMVVTVIYSKVLIAKEVIFFVESEHRGKQLGKGLITEYVKWAKETGVDYVQIENSTHADPERIAKLYQHYGFNKIGGTYQMDIK